jgi:cyclopropane fatty-acyl-phospholipid synthase-like methyltransferase
MADDRWWRDLDAVVAAMLPGGSRILDIGCGDGGLVDRLAELGFDPIGVDPHAPAYPRLLQARVEHTTGLGEFDAITSAMALHHAELPDVLQAIKRHLRPDGRLFVSEFAWDTYDQRAAAWLADHDPSDSDHSIAGWQREHGNLHTWATIRTALCDCFRATLEVGRPYLARMLRRRDLEADEHAFIDAQLLPALGIWYVAQRDR